MENHKKHYLGQRAFFLFLLRRVRLVVLIFIISLVVWWSARWVPDVYAGWVTYAATLLALVGGAYFLVMLFMSYLEYRVYTYTFTDEAFVMTSGVAMRSEVAALYHQIQNVNINRSPWDRMVGVSQIIIFMTGSERDSSHAKIVLPAVGKTKAKLVQKELLTRARKHVPA